MEYDSFGNYIKAVIDHIDLEYESTGLYGSLTPKEKNMIFAKIAEHYNNRDSINNASSDIINYIRERKYHKYEN